MSLDYRLTQGKAFAIRMRRMLEGLDKALFNAETEEEVLVILDDASDYAQKVTRKLRQSIAMRRWIDNTKAEAKGEEVNRRKPGPKSDDEIDPFSSFTFGGNK